MTKLLAAAAVLSVTLATPAFAQDRREVSEPRLPDRVCATLAPSPGNQAATLQKALDTCRAGGAVRLAPGRFDSGPLRLPSGVTLWVDRGAVLAAIPDPKLYDDGTGACGTIDRRGRACRPFLTIERASGTRIVGDGEINGNGGQRIAGGTETWWQLARRAQKENGRQNVPRLLVINDSKDITLYRVRLEDSPNFHVTTNRVQGFTVWGVIVSAPADARNTDGIDPGASEDVTITRSFISTGDDDIAIKAGGAGATRHVSITDNHFYAGHGMSIGSETNGGVSDVLVRGLTLDGTSSGLRIKSDASRGGVVERVTYQDVCIRGSKRPLDINTSYDAGATGSLIPIYRQITLRGVTGSGGGALVVRGYDARHALDILLDGVSFDPAVRWDVANAGFRVGPGGITPPPPGVTAASESKPIACDTRFVPFPAAR